MLANAEEAQQKLQHEWSDPLANRDFSRIKRDETGFTRPPAELEKTGRSRVKKKSWLMRLLGVR